MFKRLSIVTLTLSGLLLAGCTNQQSADLHVTSGKTEKTKSNTPQKSTKSTKTTKSTNEEISSKNNDASVPSTKTNSDQTQQSQNDETTDNQTQEQSDNQQNQTQQTVSLTTSQAAVEYLADKLSTTYDKSTTQYVANGKITWNDVDGYQINIYSKNSDSPVGSYLVPEDGQYFQIW